MRCVTSRLAALEFVDLPPPFLALSSSFEFIDIANTSMDLRVVVAGGSIAGVSAAVGLIRAGCRVSVFERAPISVPGGAVSIAQP